MFTDDEITYLRSQRLGRIATASAAATPDVAPVTFDVDDDGTIAITGMDPTKTLKWRNVLATGKAAFVVDDLATVDPWRPRGVKVRGSGTATSDGGRHVIRITPTTIWSWGINVGAPTHFAGIIERRDVAR